MKVIDLLNKIAKGEEIPKEIGYSRKCYYLTNNHDIDEFGGAIGMFALNDEIEIFDEDYIEDTPKEDRKIEKLDIQHLWEDVQYTDENYQDELNDIFTNSCDFFEDKINEIIDKLNGEDNEE